MEKKRKEKGMTKGRDEREEEGEMARGVSRRRAGISLQTTKEAQIVCTQIMCNYMPNYYLYSIVIHTFTHQIRS